MISRKTVITNIKGDMVIVGENEIIVDDMRITKGCIHKFDVHEVKTISKDVANICIEGKVANVYVSDNWCSEISVSLKGYGCEGTVMPPFLKITESDDTIKVAVEYSGYLFSGTLDLEIRLPYKLYDKITVDTQSGITEIDQLVMVKELNVTSQAGNVKVVTDCSNVTIKTTTGKIIMVLKAIKDSSMDLYTTGGNILVKLRRVAHLEFLPFAGGRDKDIKNEFTPEWGTGRCAHVKASTLLGKITVMD